MLVKTDNRLCARCVLPENFPGLKFDDDGVCNHCLLAPSASEVRDNVARLHAEMVAAIESNKGGRDYDCIVAYSGGKDSSYTLKALIEDYGLKCLAVTVDNGFMSDQARANSTALTAALGVDYQLFTPAWSFMSGMYKESVSNTDLHSKSAIKRASSICNSCINLINVYMIRLALMHGAKLIAGGYIGGQVPKDTAILELNLDLYMKTREATIGRFETSFGEDTRKYFDIPEALLANSQMKKITVLNPMLALNVSEEEIIKQLAPLGWKPTLDTGKNSSN
jgi:7-cyano-7-deazaguanine synthase in queuosine biosynthesis